jgi:hypothetical protein
VYKQSKKYNALGVDALPNTYGEGRTRPWLRCFLVKWVRLFYRGGFFWITVLAIGGTIVTPYAWGMAQF